MSKATAANKSIAELTYLRVIEDVTESGLTQAELGKVVGASVRTVQNWASGATLPAGARARRLLDLQYVVRELRTAYTDEGVQIWLHARNRNLDRQRPIDLLVSGEVDRVLEEAERVSGAM
jgi:transcriptional regulator with XRE-family HTH domain